MSRPGELTPLPPPPGSAAARAGPSPRLAAGRPLRQRLLLALVGMSVGSVLLAGMITVVFARRPARAAAVADLRRGLNAFAEIDAQVTIPRLQLQRIRAYVKANQVGLVAVLPDGTIVRPAFNQLGGRTPGRLLDRLNKALDRARQAANEAPAGGLPDGVTQGDLEPHAQELLAGQAVSGTKGPVVFVAQASFARARSRLINGTDVRPGDQIGGRFGTSLAATPNISMFFGVNVSHFNEARRGGLPVVGSSGINTFFESSLGIVLSRHTFLSIGGSFGVSGAGAPDTVFDISLPVRF